MKNTLLLTACAIVCFGPASVVAMTQAPSPATNPNVIQAAGTPAVPAVNPVTPPPVDPADPNDKTEAVTTDMYVTQAATADMFEIESSKLALTKSTNAEIKAFAQMMVDDHTKSSQGLKTAAATAGDKANVPATLDLKHQGLLDELNATSGAAFDKAYMQAQAAGHEDALKLHRSYAEQGDNAALKQHALDAVPVVSGHLDQAKKLAATVSG